MPRQLTFDSSAIRRLDRTFVGPVLRRPRRNLALAVAGVNYFRQHLKRDTIRSSDLEQIVQRLGLGHLWKISTDAKAGHGLQRALGELLGEGGLRLERGSRSAGGIVYTIPEGGVTDEYLSSLGLDPVQVEEQLSDLVVHRIDPEIVTAVRERHPINFRYEGDPPEAGLRLFLPHAYMVNGDKDNLDGWQESGYSSSGNSTGWRCFHTDRMLDLVVLEQRTFSVRPEFKPEHPKYNNTHAIAANPSAQLSGRAAHSS